MMTTDERQQRMAERILEDENLRGDLEDDAATALVDWASARAAAAAADPARSDAAVEAQVLAIRQAARAAARSGETVPQRLIALAIAKLAPSNAAVDVAPPAESTPASAPAKPAVVLGDSAVESVAPPADPPLAREAAAPVAAASAVAPPTPATPPAKQSSASARKPAGSTSNRSRRKRSRLARFLKRILGGR
jgi:hypothetical protein